MKLRFHWMLPKAGEVEGAAGQTPQAAARYRRQTLQPDSPAARLDLAGWASFAQRAEESGIESVMIALNEPDPLLISCALGGLTKRLRFIVTHRSGLMHPTSFVHQINTLSTLIGGRVAVNLVAGRQANDHRAVGDLLDDDEVDERTKEFLTVCNAFWSNGGEVNFDGRYYRVEKGKLHTPFSRQGPCAPRIYVSGDSQGAEQWALAGATCLLHTAKSPEQLQLRTALARSRGLEVGVNFYVVCRPTREEAIEVARSLLPDDEHRTAHGVDPRDGWINQSLWVGTPQDIAADLLK